MSALKQFTNHLTKLSSHRTNTHFIWLNFFYTFTVSYSFHPSLGTVQRNINITSTTRIKVSLTLCNSVKMYLFICDYEFWIMPSAKCHSSTMCYHILFPFLKWYICSSYFTTQVSFWRWVHQCVSNVILWILCCVFSLPVHTFLYMEIWRTEGPDEDIFLNILWEWRKWCV